MNGKIGLKANLVPASIAKGITPPYRRQILDLDRIISELGSERDRISRAIKLLENKSRNDTREAAVPRKTATSKKLSGGLTPAGRKRLSEAMKRWAKRSGSTGTSRKTAAPVRTATQEKKRGGLTAAGRKRLSQAMKKRWAARRKKSS